MKDYIEILVMKWLIKRIKKGYGTCDSVDENVLHEGGCITCKAKLATDFLQSHVDTHYYFKDINKMIKKILEHGLIILAVLAITAIVTSLSVSIYNYVNLPKVEKVVEVPVYKWNQCFDNDYPSFNQEYPDTKADKAFAEAKKDNPTARCAWDLRGRKDILGCTGDLFYSFTCK